MKLIKNLILIGYRGTGKTTVARLLAEQFAWKWVDADAYLSDKYQRTIRTIFQDEGEAGFREKEAAVLCELLQREEQVIATGGGIVLREDNRLRLKEGGKVVWLTADAETIRRRLQADSVTKEQRPALTTGDFNEVKHLLDEREPLYRECADLIVDTVGRTPEEVAASVLREWRTAYKHGIP